MLSAFSLVLELTLNLLWGSVYIVTGIVNISLELSCLLGYVIVRNSITFFTAILQVLTGLVRLITVLIEDYSVFISDVIIILSSIFNVVLQCTESLYNSVVNCLLVLYSSISAAGSSVINILTSVFVLLYHLFTSILNLYLLFKKTCLLVGLNVWNIVTEVPGFFIFVIYLWKQKVTEGLVLLLIYIQSGLQCVLDFPVKPVCGLSIAILLFFVVLKKRYSLWHMAYRTWLISTNKCQQLVILGWQTFEGYVLWLLTNQTRDRLRLHFVDRPNDNMDDSTSDEGDTEGSSDDNQNSQHVTKVTVRKRKNSRTVHSLNEEMDVRLCVVCQDKTRCIVTLPCRHVCLCNTCCTAVRQQQGLCPLCRQEITYAGRVYL